MQPLTPEKLAANAYRTLGISASSSQAAIESAARKMRIWPDPSRIAATPFDLPSLGLIGRSRSDIEQAVSRLNEPASRVEERLLWYHAAPSPTSEAISSTNESIDDRHSAALSLLHKAATEDPNVSDPDRWSWVMDRVSALATSPACETWQNQIEAEGDFDKRATEEEITQAVASLPVALTDALVIKAQEAIDRNDSAACASIFELLRNAGPSVARASNVTEILDRLEDSFEVLCRELESELRGKLRTNRNEPHPYFAANYAATLAATKSYNDTIWPLFSQLRGLAAVDPERQLRVRTTCAVTLAALGLGWEWAGQYVLAEQTLEQGLQVGEDTAADPGLRKDLERVAPNASQERQFGQSGSQRTASIAPQPVRSTKPKGKSSMLASIGSLRGSLILLVVIGKLVAYLVVGSSSSSSDSSYTPLKSSNFTQTLQNLQLKASSPTIPFPSPGVTVGDGKSEDSVPTLTTRPFDFGEMIREP